MRKTPGNMQRDDSKHFVFFSVFSVTLWLALLTPWKSCCRLDEKALRRDVICLPSPPCSKADDFSQQSLQPARQANNGISTMGTSVQM
jgi:hypothetical protein